ncbi:MAG: S41 family peptidase [Phycisphaerae bacterium]
MSQRNVVCLAIVVTIAILFYLLTPMVAEQDSVYRTFAPLVEVDAIVKRNFVFPLQGRRLVDGAIRGLMLDLDPYSGYIAPEQMRAFERRHTGEYIGIGVELGLRIGDVVVIAPLEQGPAIEAGVRPGDIVLAVEGRSVQDLSIPDVEGLLAGEPATIVELKLRRADGEVYVRAIKRTPIKRQTVKGIRRHPDGAWDFCLDAERHVGYIRISHFDEGTSDDFDAALRDVTRRGGTSLVIDLRFNPGGVFPEAVAMVDRFIDSGIIVTTVRRRQAIDTYHAARRNVDTDMQLAVLLNGGSASASEIFAGALQDHGRAIVIGERSFGKGSVQDFIRLAGGEAGIKLTVAHYQLPRGRIIHKTPQNVESDEWGVVPDVAVPVQQSVYDAIRRRWAHADRSAMPGVAADDTETTSLIDPQLKAAIEKLTAAR